MLLVAGCLLLVVLLIPSTQPCEIAQSLRQSNISHGQHLATNDAWLNEEIAEITEYLYCSGLSDINSNAPVFHIQSRILCF
jgi:hypothetical protein